MSWMISKALMDSYENSLSSQAREAVCLADTCSDGEPSAQLNVMPTPRPFWLRDKMTGSSSPFPSGLTLKLLSQSRGEDVLTWYRQGFHVKTSALQVRAQGLMGQSPGCGERLSGSFAEWDHVMCSWRTRQTSLISGLGSFSVTWPEWGTMRAGACWALTMPVLHIPASGFGLWPTPSGVKSSRSHCNGVLGDWGGSGNRFRGTSLQKVHCPAFEEWMMGWPEAWTELTPAETDKFQQWLRLHGKS